MWEMFSVKQTVHLQDFCKVTHHGEGGERKKGGGGEEDHQSFVKKEQC